MVIMKKRLFKRECFGLFDYYHSFVLNLLKVQNGTWRDTYANELSTCTNKKGENQYNNCQFERFKL